MDEMDDRRDDHIARILDPAYLDDLRSRSIDEIRAMRAECQGIETGLSFLRRVVQGRLDIADAELTRRREGGDPADLSALIEQLPEILADHLRAPGNGRLPSSLGEGEPDAELDGRLRSLVSEYDLDAIGDLDDGRLVAARDALAELETDVSGRRRALFDRIDALQAELTRRYKTGEASVESLLR
jgi:hypothetical protein